MSGGVVFTNPASGKDHTSPAELAAAFPHADVQEIEGPDLAAGVGDAVTGGAPWVGVAGGDGSQRAAAAVLADTGVPLLPIPTGTCNHLAADLGIGTVDEAAEAARDGRLRSVDLGDVNGETFVNNSSIGFYAAMVRERARHEGERPKRVADLMAAWAQVCHGHRFRVAVEGRRWRAWLLFVGNGSYGARLGEFCRRERLDSGSLDVRVVDASRRLARMRVAGAVLTGRLNGSPVVQRWTLESAEVEPEGDAVDVAVDGDVVRLRPPLRYKSRAGALTVVVPHGEGPPALA